MVTYFKEPVKRSAKEYGENEANEGKAALINVEENLMYAEGNDDDWVELEEKRESFDNWRDFYVITGPISKMTINSLGWR